MTDNATAEIPVSVRQEFIDDAPAGQVLKSLTLTRPDDGLFAYRVEGVYQSVASPASVAATMVYGRKVVNLYYITISVPALTYEILGEFSVPFDGTPATCTAASHGNYVSSYDNPYGYQFDFLYSTTYLSGCNGRVTFYFDVYHNGVKQSPASDYASIACDPYGNVY